MKSSRRQTVMAVMLAGSLTCSYAGGAAIGVAMASGKFRVDRVELMGNASLFDGAEVQTSRASSKLRVGTSRLELATESQAKVYAQRMVLEKGAAQVESTSSYTLEARTLRINPDDQAVARVELQSGRVLVSAVNGPVRVSNAAGMLVARLSPGKNLYFSPQAGNPEAFDIFGCVLQKGGKFVIVDTATTQVYELRGGELTALLANRAEVKGKVITDPKPLEGATQAIQVESSVLQAPGGCLAIAQAIGADPLPGAAQVGKGKGNKKAMAAGAAGGAAAGAAAAGAAGGAAAAGISTGVLVGVGVAAAGGTAAAVALSQSGSSKSP